MNRRESPRVDIKLRCHVTSPGLWMRGTMFTENISRSGILLAWSHEIPGAPLPNPGEIVTIEIELPAHHGFGQKCIHCQGTIVRVLQDKAAPRVAVSLNYMKFRSYHHRMPALGRLEPAASNSWIA